MRHDQVFEQLEPPSEGLAQLRARLDERPRLVRRAAPFAMAAALAAVIAILLTRSRSMDPVAAARAHSDTAEVGLGLAHAPTAALALEASTSTTTAITEVRSENPDVRFYWVSSTRWRD